MIKLSKSTIYIFCLVSHKKLKSLVTWACEQCKELPVCPTVAPAARPGLSRAFSYKYPPPLPRQPHSTARAAAGTSMRLLALLLAFFLVLAIAEAAAARKGKGKGRRGNLANTRRAGRRTRPAARRGRQDEDVAAAADDANAVDGEYEEGEEEVAALPNGCDALTEIGAFMNYPKLLMWCIEVRKT